jgi:hypothetical protein
MHSTALIHVMHPRFEEEKSRSVGYVSVREGSDGELYGLRPQELTLQDASGAVTVVNADVGESCYHVYIDTTCVLQSSAIYAMHWCILNISMEQCLRLKGVTSDAVQAFSAHNDEPALTHKVAHASAVIVCDNHMTDLVRQLIALPDTALIGVWVSLDSLPAIEARLNQTLQSEQQQQQQQSTSSSSSTNSISNSDDGDVPLSAEALLDRRVNQALEDIEFGVTSGVFEFTIIDAEAPGSLAKLRKAVEYAR